MILKMKKVLLNFLRKNRRRGFSSSSVQRMSSDRSVSPGVRVRFAPSPTGYLHVGGLRTALYNYLFAKAHNGSFILRIEDTDQSRLVEGAIEKLEEDLHWAGLDPDESPSCGGSYGPYIQSKRVDLYRTEVDILLSKGLAYYCFCSDRRLDILRKDALRRREVPKYDNCCRNLTKDEVQEKLEARMAYCLRFKLTSFPKPYEDLVYGLVRHDVMLVEGDPVILKSDGFPTYHLANVIDDHYMKITHVLRGVEWQPSTVKHLLLYDAFGWEPPVYAHLPLLLNEDGSKLSKRHGDMTVEAYRKNGIYPGALINFLTLCGGGFTRDSNTNASRSQSISELTQKFSLSLMNANNCVLPLQRVKEYNQAELKRLILEESHRKKLVKQLRELITNASAEAESLISLSDSRLEDTLLWGVNNNRISSLKDLIGPEFGFLWVQPTESSILKHHLEFFDTLTPLIEDVKDFNTLEDRTLNVYLKNYAEEKQLKYSKFMQFLRSCLSGLKDGPRVSEMLILLGKEESLQRLRRAQNLRSRRSATDAA